MENSVGTTALMLNIGRLIFILVEVLTAIMATVAVPASFLVEFEAKKLEK